MISEIIFSALWIAKLSRHLKLNTNCGWESIALVNSSPGSFSHQFAAEHKPCIWLFSTQRPLPMPATKWKTSHSVWNAYCTPHLHNNRSHFVRVSAFFVFPLYRSRHRASRLALSTEWGFKLPWVAKHHPASWLKVKKLMRLVMSVVLSCKLVLLVTEVRSYSIWKQSWSLSASPRSKCIYQRKCVC